MPAKPVDLAAFRASRRAPLGTRRKVLPRHGLPLVLTAYRDAVSIVAGEAELWASPDQADDLARDLSRLAAIARKGKPSRG